MAPTPPLPPLLIRVFFEDTCERRGKTKRERASERHIQRAVASRLVGPLEHLSCNLLEPTATVAAGVPD